MPQRQCVAVGLLVIVALACRVAMLNKQQEHMQLEMATLTSSLESLQRQHQAREEARALQRPVTAPQVKLPSTVVAPADPPSTPHVVPWEARAPPVMQRGSTMPRTDQCDGHRTSSGAPPLLVLGTTMGDASGDELKRSITRNTLRGFMSQTPPDAVRPLVFVDSEELAREVRAETANVFPGIETTSSEFESFQGWPTFRSIMKSAEAAAVAAGAPFFGYSNGDIIFTEDLVVTLRLVREALDSGEMFSKGGLGSDRGKGLLVVGRRTNFDVAAYAEHLSHNNQCDLAQDFFHIAKEGDLMLPWSCDYFIAVPGTFDWEQFPEYIVGNIAFDQAVISIAVREGVHIVEATDTIHAFHQTGPEGNSAGHKNRGPAKRHNQGLFRGPDTNGCKWTSCAQYHTAWRHPTFGSPDSVADSSDALPTPVIQKVQPGNSLLGVAHPIPDKVFASKCSVGHRGGGGGGGSGRTVMAQFQQRLPSLGEDEEDVHAFSFGLYLAQTCRMLICTPVTQGSGPKLTSEYYRKQVASSGVIPAGSAEQMWAAAGCDYLYPGFRVDPEQDIQAGVDRLKRFELAKARWPTCL